MDVTRKTLQAVLPILRQTIQKCDFIAIDTELSGLHRVASEAAHTLDTPQIRYEKLKASSQAFAVLQFGVAMFTWDSGLRKYVVSAFNFPVFPQAGKQVLGLDRRFLVESSAVDFLLNQGFNFDNTFKNGIPYVRFDEEEIARSNIAKLENLSQQPNIQLDHTNRDFVETAMKNVQDWLDTSSEPFVAITAENGYKKRLIHQEVRLRFKSTLSTRSRSKEIFVSKLSVAERERILNGEDEQKTKLTGELEYLIGFRRVIEMISESRKPLIGHNMYLDLCQTVQKFCFELPPTISEFKDVCHSVFPVIYDTKHIANTDLKILDYVKNSTLSDMAEQLEKFPFTKPEMVMHSDFQDYLSSATEKFHEAGYDAFSTGVAFLKMMHHIADVPVGERLDFSTHPTPEAKASSSSSSDEPAATVSSARAQLDRFENKLNVMRSDEPVLRLVGDEDEASLERTNILYIANFPATWRTHHLLALCTPHVGHGFVRWINDSACFLAVSDRTKITAEAVDAIKVAVLSKRLLDGETTEGAGVRTVRVMVYKEYAEREEELKAEQVGKQEEKRSAAPALPSGGRKRVRMAGEEEEDGEIFDDGEQGQEGSPKAVKRQKSDSECVIC
ncbi:hypothetical protein HDU98_007197 [Podochytrium sp. JEL0797]|nr:hypothetical protein HDU98_007197 [Podochytrium sp. JEL0797]